MSASYIHRARKVVCAWLDVLGRSSVDEPAEHELEKLAALIEDEMRGVAIETRRVGMTPVGR